MYLLYLESLRGDATYIYKENEIDRQIVAVDRCYFSN